MDACYNQFEIRLDKEIQKKRKKETTYLAVNAVMRRRPADYGVVAKQIASIVLDTYPKVFEKDSLVINVVYGYDIGLATAWRNRKTQHTPQDWKELLSRPHAKQKI